MFSGLIEHGKRMAELALTDTATIQRATFASDGEGGQTATWATLATVAARLQASGNSDEIEIAKRASSVAAWTVVLPVGTDVTDQDRIVINGKSLEVIGVVNGRTFGPVDKAICQEIS